MDILSLNKKMVCPESDIKLVGHILGTGVNPVGILAGRVEIVKYLDTEGKGGGALKIGGKTYDYSDTGDHETSVAYLACHDVPNMRIRSYKVNMPDGGHANEALAAVLEYVKAHPSERHIVNMSISLGSNDPSYINRAHDLIKQLVALNVAIVVSGTNARGKMENKYPQCFYEVIVVSGLNNNGTRGAFASQADTVDFCEIGQEVPTIDNTGKPVRRIGESFASPIVFSKLAKIWCGNPDLTEPQLYEAAVKNTMDLGADGHDPYFGWGWIQSVKAPAATVRPLAKISAFVSWLKAQVGHIYMWGGQGETATESLIKRRETSTANANRAIALLRKRKAEGMETVLAYDCSGLGMKWLMDKKILPKDLTAAGMYSVCQKITKADLKARDMVFVYGLSRGKMKIHHVGYVVDDSLNVVEAMGRDVGVVMRPLSAGKWNRYGRLNSLQG